MDLIKTGKFIKEQRKAKGLTQEELAAKIFVSEKTISKWECGNGFPDTSLILPLCESLGISANELLSGKKLKESEYKQQAEENLVLLKNAQEKNAKFLLALECVLGISSVVILLGFTLLAGLLEMATWLRITLIAAGVVLSVVNIAYCLLIEKDAGYYECQHCHHKHIPAFKQILWSMHMGRTRYMNCPNCHKKSWQKKVVK